VGVPAASGLQLHAIAEAEADVESLGVPGAEVHAAGVQRHARRAKRIYEGRRDALAEALRRDLGGVLSFTLPAGGMALWARVDPSVDPDAWADRALAKGVAFYPGRRFSFDGRRRPFVRLGFAALDEEELGEAVKRMAAALG
jgi:GntR family transcriptional regulator / MocR family aminotransferase